MLTSLGFSFVLITCTYAGHVERIGNTLADTRLGDMLSVSSFKSRTAASADNISTAYLQRLLERERRRAAAAERRSKELCRDVEMLEKCVQEARSRELQATMKLTQRELEMAKLQCELDSVRKMNKRRSAAIHGVTEWLTEQRDGSALQRLAQRREDAANRNGASDVTVVRQRMHA